MDWSDLCMEWGTGGKVDYCIEEPGKPGKALHFTTVPVQDATSQTVDNPCRALFRGSEIANEGRCLQWNHEPGTPATIAFDFKVFQANEKAWFRVYYYDGYVTAEFFQVNLTDPFYAIPEAIVSWTPEQPRDWKHYELTTPPLTQPVLTLWIQAAQSQPPGYIDAAMDNLSVTLTPSKKFYDPGLDWGSEDYDKMNNCRQSNGCRQIPWCDSMYDEFGPAWPGSKEMIYYGSMETFRGTSGNYQGLLSMKHDFWHRHRDGQIGGRSGIGLSSIHASGEAKSMGIRQTFTYEALGLKRGRKAKIIVQTSGASAVEQNGDGLAGRTLLGVDPYGDILGNKKGVIWSEEGTANWYKQWKVHKLEFERPVDAEALTVFLKWRDGQNDETCDDKAPNGNSGWFDWVKVDVTPMK